MDRHDKDKSFFAILQTNLQVPSAQISTSIIHENSIHYSFPQILLLAAFIYLLPYNCKVSPQHIHILMVSYFVKRITNMFLCKISAACHRIVTWVYILWNMLWGLTCILSSPSDCKTNKCQHNLNIILFTGDWQNHANSCTFFIKKPINACMIMYIIYWPHLHVLVAFYNHAQGVQYRRVQQKVVCGKSVHDLNL
jgi:hypothetical protein